MTEIQLVKAIAVPWRVTHLDGGRIITVVLETVVRENARLLFTLLPAWSQEAMNWVQVTPHGTVEMNWVSRQGVRRGFVTAEVSADAVVYYGDMPDGSIPSGRANPTDPRGLMQLTAMLKQITT